MRIFLFLMLLYFLFDSETLWAESNYLRDSELNKIQVLDSGKERSIRNSFLDYSYNDQIYPHFKIADFYTDIDQDIGVLYLTVKLQLSKPVNLELVVNGQKIPVNKNNNGIFVFSFVRKKPLSIDVLAQIEIKSEDNVFKYDLIYDPVSNNVKVYPLFSLNDYHLLCSKNQIWFGLSINYFTYDQLIPESDIKAKYQSQSLGGSHFSIQYSLTPRFGIYGSIGGISDEIDKAQITSITTDELNKHSWSHYEVGVEYSFLNYNYAKANLFLYPYFKFGISRNEFKRIAIDSSDEAHFRSLNINHTSFSLGFKAYYNRNYFLDSFFSFKPAIESPGYTINATEYYNVGISIGKFIEPLAVGIVWQGHQIKTLYRESAGIDTSPGQIQLFFNDLIFQIGFLF